MWDWWVSWSAEEESGDVCVEGEGVGVIEAGSYGGNIIQIIHYQIKGSTTQRT